jgi:hypothetical protein
MPERRNATRAHWAHAGVVALHTLCCGLPLAVSLLGLAASASLMGGVLTWHAVLHERELWLLAGSAALVAIGAFAEWRFVRADRGRRISALFAVSLACFALNGAIVAGHRTGSFAIDAVASSH